MFSMYLTALANATHLLAAVIWIGGMFFAYVALRPAAGQLDAATRLRLWVNTFKRFFPWVFICIIILLISGLWLLFYYKAGYISGAHIHTMISLGIVMMLIFLHVYFAPFKRLRNAVTDEDWDKGAKSLAQIRVMIGINLTIGLIVVAAVGLGSML